MRIQIGITLDYDGDPALLHERLLAWSLHGSYRLEEHAPDRWVFRRGGFWRSMLVGWDVYQLPCEVTVLHLPLSKQVAAALECSSWFHFQTPGDRPKLEAEMGRLRATLCDLDRWQPDGGDGIRPAGPTDIQ